AAQAPREQPPVSGARLAGERRGGGLVAALAPDAAALGGGERGPGRSGPGSGPRAGRRRAWGVLSCRRGGGADVRGEQRGDAGPLLLGQGRVVSAVLPSGHEGVFGRAADAAGGNAGLGSLSATATT